MRKFGVEIEAIGMTKDDVAALLRRNGIECSSGWRRGVSNSWKVVGDGSLCNPTYGFELVSPPLYATEENFALVRRVLNILAEAGVGVNKKCGLHVHIDVAEFTATQIANVYNRYRKFEEQIEKFQAPSRRGQRIEGYCKAIRFGSALQVRATTQQTCNQQASRYHTVNLQAYAKYGTIEFRQHAGSVNGIKVVNWIRFLVQFCEESKRVNLQTATSVSRGKKAQVLNLLRNGSYSAEQLATFVGSTVKSIQSMICHLRREATISYRRGYYSLIGVNSAALNDSLWSGIDASLKTYFDSRARALAA